MSGERIREKMGGKGIERRRGRKEEHKGGRGEGKSGWKVLEVVSILGTWQLSASFPLILAFYQREWKDRGK